MLNRLIPLQSLMLVILVAGCATQPTQVASSANATSNSGPGPVSPMSTPALLWTTFESESGVVIEYPAEWTIESEDDSVVFVSPSGSRVFLGVYSRPIEDRALADPYEWYEGDYQIQWARPVSIPGVDGILLVWARPEGELQEASPQLIAVFYSEERELDVRLTTSFEEHAIDLATERGFEDSILSEFADFLRMMSSIRIDRGQGSHAP